MDGRSNGRPDMALERVRVPTLEYGSTVGVCAVFRFSHIVIFQAKADILPTLHRPEIDMITYITSAIIDTS